ncbi:MAG TPA: cytochrome c oxidase subunit I [Steroidobacteraceae bacterium]|nr:cytochrome c oxidase subunit I [Steroidobacteraceae bacterium]
MTPLEATWNDRPGLMGWLATTDHKRVAQRYIVTTLVFFALAGLMAAVMRAQLAQPDNHLVGPDRYDQLFSMHGTAMMFLFAVPVMEAVALYLIPLMVGTRNVAFPRLNAYGYWLFLFGGLMSFTVFFLNIGPEAGWFSYVPLAGPQYSPGKRQDFYAQLVTFTEVAALIGAIQIIVTAFKMRTPGMTLARMPLFVWAMVATAFMILFAMPSVMLATTFLITDRMVSTQFYNPAEGGDALLWQHLFWFFGHPEVYIIFVPALGMISEILPTFARRKVVGYAALVIALVTISFLSFGLWVHHMFVTGLPPLGMSFFTAASIMIALPTGLQIFCWIATLATGARVTFATPFLFVIGFFFIFVIGGLTGIMLGASTLDQQLHDSYFVVAHLHYVLIGGAVFPLFGAFYFWFPKLTGRLLSERAGRWNFWLFFIGFNVAFFPMHILGLEGMPRRIYTYSEASGWQGLNLLSTLGALTIAASMLVFGVNVLRSWRRGQAAPDNPWRASGLEWATSSPPPSYNFAELPTVASRTPLWDADFPPATVTGLPEKVRSALVTHVHDAEPDHVEILPGPSVWPFLAAIATTLMFIGTVFTPWALPIGSIPIAITLIGWFWPSADEAETLREIEVPPPEHAGASPEAAA